MADQVPDEPDEGPDTPGLEEHEYTPDALNAAALMEIAHNLPRYDGVNEAEALSIYGDLQAALHAFIRIRHRAEATRAPVATVRASLRHLDCALAELKEAWAAADERTKGHLSETVGEQPFEPWEQQPLTEAKEPADAWTRGAYRIAKFRQGADRIAVGVATLKEEFDEKEQDRTGPIPGLHDLTASLAEIFTRHTRREFSRSTNNGSAREFVISVIATLPPQWRPGNGSVEHSMKHVIKQAQRAADK